VDTLKNTMCKQHCFYTEETSWRWRLWKSKHV